MVSRERREGRADLGDRDPGQAFGQPPPAVEKPRLDEGRGRPGVASGLQMIMAIVTISGNRDEESSGQRRAGVRADSVHFRIFWFVVTGAGSITDRTTPDDVGDFTETSANQGAASPRLRARAAAATSTSSKCRRSVPTIW